MCWGYSSPWHEELFCNYQIFFLMQNGTVQAAWGWAWDTEGVAQWVPDLPDFVWLKPVKTDIWLNKDGKCKKVYTLYVYQQSVLRNLTAPPCDGCSPQHPPHEVMHRSRASRKLQLHTDTEGFCSGSGASPWTFGADVKICRTEQENQCVAVFSLCLSTNYGKHKII